MKKLLPAIIAILIIPFAFACKKGTNSTGTVTNGVARVELTINPAVIGPGQVMLDIQVKSPTSGTNVGTVTIPTGTTKYVSDDYAVTEGQNFTYFLNTNVVGGCYSITGDIFYNNIKVSSKSFNMGTNLASCKDGSSTSHNAIVK
ncbi:MAG: hypothetical protein ORN56_07120 [Chitinophagales bacterium]|nr:hypothetical protein [Chitinophagales bacterium]